MNTSARQPLLEVRNLEVTYAGGAAAVRGVNLSLDAGQKLGVAGESGCGKSTLALAMLRLLPAGTRTSGRSCSTARTCCR